MKKLFYTSLLALVALTGCGGNNASSSKKASSSSSLNENSSDKASSSSSSSKGESSSASSSSTSSGSTFSSTSSSSTSSSSSSSAQVDEDDDFAEALQKDYSNMTVGNYLSYFDGETIEEFYEFVNDNYVVSYDQNLEADGYDPYAYYYVDADGVSWNYWDADSSNPNSKGGWLNKGYNNADLSVWKAYFYMPLFINNITPEDVTYAGDGMYYVNNPEAVERLNMSVFGYAWYNDIQDITILVEDGYITRIIGFCDEDYVQDPVNYVDIMLSNIGSTELPDVPAVPNPANKTTYWQYKGWESDYTNVYIQSVTTEITSEVKSDEEYDVILELDEEFTMAYDTTPNSFEAWEIVDTTVEWHTSQDGIVEIDYTFVPKQKVIKATAPGEVEIWVSAVGENGDITSEKIKVKVNDVKEQEKANAIYDFSFVAIDAEESILAVNNIDGSVAPYTITSNRGGLRDGKYSDIFDAGKEIFYLDPLSTDFSKPTGAYITFDFGEQQVSAMSFYYGLIYSSQSTYVSKLAEAKVRTSNDGETWVEYDFLDLLKSTISADHKKLYELEFEPASMVQIYLKSNTVGNTLNVAFDDFVFSANDACNDYVAPVE